MGGLKEEEERWVGCREEGSQSRKARNGKTISSQGEGLK